MTQPSSYQEYSLISATEATQSKVSLAYIIGFLLADGSFQISFQKNNTFTSKYMIIVKLNFSQNIDTEKSRAFFEVLRESLYSYGLTTGKIKLHKRAGQLDVWGALNFGKLKDLLLKEKILSLGDDIIPPLAGTRYRDFLILEAVENLRQKSILLTHYGLMLALRLRYNLHCKDKHGILPPIRGNRKSYEEALVHYSTPANIDYQSLAPRFNSEADNILSEIDQKVHNQHMLITGGILSQNLRVDPWWVTGFFEGDGCSTVSFVLNQWNTFVPRIGISMISHPDNKPVLEIVQYFFKQPHFSWPSQMNRNHDYIYEWSGHPYCSLRFFSLYFFRDVMAPFFKEYPLQSIKYHRLNMCYNVVMQHVTDQLNNVENLICVVKNIYQTPTLHISEKSRLPLPELIDRIYALSEQTVTPSRIAPLSVSLPPKDSLPRVIETSSGDEGEISDD